MSLSTVILLLAGIAAALMAGLFFAWSISVMPGLALLNDEQYLAAMQAMNRAILNPVFLVCFLSPLLLLPLASYLHYHYSQFGWLLAATFLYYIGVIAVTFFGNVPLNEHLDKLNLSQVSIEELSKERMVFEKTWVHLNNVRTVLSTVVALLMLYACLLSQKQTVSKSIKETKSPSIQNTINK